VPTAKFGLEVQPFRAVNHENSEISEFSLCSRAFKPLIFNRLPSGCRGAFIPSERQGQMTLRIDISDERERVIFTLTGRIQAEQLSELQTLVHSQLPDHNLVLDLTEVRLVDRDAVRFLAQIEAQGARLRNCSAFIREWISQERNEMKRAEAQHQQL
jgi:ABC-type transporter Mla MlaB component